MWPSHSMGISVTDVEQEEEEKDMKVHVGDEQLDQEWVQLMQKAKQMGMTPEEVRHFLKLTEKSICSGGVPQRSKGG